MERISKQELFSLTAVDNCVLFSLRLMFSFAVI